MISFFHRFIDDYNFSRPFVYVKHLNFLDTREFGVPLPIYMNIVRHPVDRVYAWYYYIRAPWYVIDPKPQDIVATNIKSKDIAITGTKNSTGSFNDTDDESPQLKEQRKWNWKKNKQPNLRFLKTSYLDCLENSYWECQYPKGNFQVCLIYCLYQLQ